MISSARVAEPAPVSTTAGRAVSHAAPSVNSARASTGPGHDLGRVRVRCDSSGAASVRSERDADAVAERALAGDLLPPPPTHLPVAARGSAASTGVRGAGRRLDPQIRSDFEPGLGWDLGAVRIHTDAEAATAAQLRGARAYTIGSDVVFGRGEYNPASTRGRRLLAHELAHVVQQGTGATPVGVQRQAESVQAVADRMTLAELEAAVQQLRVEVSESVESSEEGLQTIERLRVFEQTLTVRQGPSVAAAGAATATRTGIGAALASEENAATRLVGGALLLDDSADALFAQGFLAGCIGAIPPGEVEDFRSELLQRWPEVYAGYLYGLPVGLWNGLTGLVSGVGMLLQAAFWLSPAGLSILTTDQLFQFARDPEAYLAARRREYGQFRAVADAIERFGTEFAADPTVVLTWSSELGMAAGEECGELLTTLLRKPPFDKGQVVGEVVGQVVFEVLLEIILAATTAGIGNALRAVAAVGQGARVSGRLANVIRRMLDASPAVRRVITAVTAGSDEAAAALRVASAGADTAGDAAQAVRTTERATEVGADVATVSDEAGQLAAGGPARTALADELAPKELGSSPEAPGEPATPRLPEEAGLPVRVERELVNALGEPHAIKVLADGTLMRCSVPVCQSIAVSVRGRAAKLPAAMQQEANLLAKRAEQLQKQALDVAAQGLNDKDRMVRLDALAEKAVDVEQSMSKLEQKAGVATVRPSPPFTRTQQDIDDLARDPDSKLQITTKGEGEAVIGLDLEGRNPPC